MKERDRHDVAEPSVLSFWSGYIHTLMFVVVRDTHIGRISAHVSIAVQFQHVHKGKIA